MPEHIHQNTLLFVMAMHLVFTASFIAPEPSLELLLKIRGLPELFRRRRLEKKSRLLEQRLKKCWLVDLRKNR